MGVLSGNPGHRGDLSPEKLPKAERRGVTLASPTSCPPVFCWCLPLVASLFELKGTEGTWEMPFPLTQDRVWKAREGS